jgi:anti-sigma factor RsiW
VTGPHPADVLVPFIRNELDEAERRRVARHLEGCEECRTTAADFQAILERLAATPPPVPDPHWGRYRADLRARLEARRGAPWRRWMRPLPVAMAAAATTAVILTLTLGDRGVTNGDIKSLDEAAVAGRLDLLDKRAIVERLDLLEDLDVIHDLDQLVDTREG